MLKVNNLIGFQVKKPLKLTYIETQLDEVVASGFTFPSVNLGGGGLVIVQVQGRWSTASDPVISSATIDGVSATVNVATSTEMSTQTGIISAAQSGGGTGKEVDITLSGTGTWRYCSIHVYTLTGHNSATPHDTDYNTATDVTSISSSLNIPAGGVAIGGSVSRRKDEAVTWTNLADENYDGIIADSGRVSSASEIRMVAETGRTITSTWSTSSQEASISSASWV